MILKILVFYLKSCLILYILYTNKYFSDQWKVKEHRIAKRQISIAVLTIQRIASILVIGFSDIIELLLNFIETLYVNGRLLPVPIGSVLGGVAPIISVDSVVDTLRNAIILLKTSAFYFG